MAITVAQLQTFIAVSREGSVKGAAARLVVTQPSVSGALSSLERELGVKLFERRGRGVAPTEAGLAFGPYAERTLALMSEGRRAALDAADPGSPRLEVAAVNTAGEYIVPPVLRAFRESFPRVEVGLAVSNRAGVFRRLRSREADLGVGGSPPEDGEFEGVPFLENNHVMVAAPDHPLALRDGIGNRELGGETWLLREPGSGTRLFVDRLLAERGMVPQTMTLGSNGAVKQAVRGGLGISLQSRWAVALELALGLLVELDLSEPLPERRWYALRPVEAPRRAAVEEFLGFLCGEEARRAVAEAQKLPGI
ncbi:MAG: LysR family transcriptional regulator [Rubrobacter sp.]|nr:LysR family transcriptional regulator [Rubrobacter sp.]